MPVRVVSLFSLPATLLTLPPSAVNTSCDYSAAYLILYTGPPGTPRTTPPSSTGPLLGAGMTFTIGRGNEVGICSLFLLLSFSSGVFFFFPFFFFSLFSL